VSFHGSSVWSRMFVEFHCPECGSSDAYCSRRRGFFEKYILRIVMRPVRCERCSHRSYAFRWFPAQERRHAMAPQPESQLSPGPGAQGRIA
jgi:hypothetical protein